MIAWSCGHLLFPAILLVLQFFFLVVLVVELRALCLLGVCCAAWATPGTLLVVAILELGSCCFAQASLDCNLPLFKLPAVGKTTGVSHYAQLLIVEMGSHKLFCLGWPGTPISPISASQVARITGMSPWHLAWLVKFLKLNILYWIGKIEINTSNV
jgi:hypothetical protein